MEKTTTAEFIDLLWELSQRPLPERVVDEVKKCLIDQLGCIYIGAASFAEIDQKYLDLVKDETRNCSLIGSSRKTDVYTAAFLNAVHGHYMELDDGHRYGMVHLGAPIISALLAVAQNNDLSADDLLRGIVVGYEATVRLAMAIQPGHKKIGFHATGTCGTVGTALAVASALGYEKELWNCVISAAATGASGLLRMIDGGSQLKVYNIGHAAVSGLQAAYFAHLGLQGPEDVLDGERGFFKTLASEVKREHLTERKDRYMIETIYRKPYAACRHCHPAIEAALRAKLENGIEIDDIDRIIVKTYDLAIRGHDHKTIANGASAKMSIPYSVAAAIAYDKADYEVFADEKVGDETLQKLMGIMDIEEDPELSKLVPEKRAACVVLETDKGSYQARVDYPLGEPEHPLTWKDLEDKYLSLMKAAGRQEDNSRGLLNAIYNINDGLKELLVLL